MPWEASQGEVSSRKTSLDGSMFPRKLHIWRKPLQLLPRAYMYGGDREEQTIAIAHVQL